MQVLVQERVSIDGKMVANLLQCNMFSICPLCHAFNYTVLYVTGHTKLILCFTDPAGSFFLKIEKCN